MLKKCVVALILGLLQFQQPGSVNAHVGELVEFKPSAKAIRGTKIVDGKTTSVKLANKELINNFPMNTFIHYRFHPDQDGYKYTPYDDLPLRIVTSNDGIDTITFGHLDVDILDLPDQLIHASQCPSNVYATGTCFSQDWDTWILRLKYDKDTQAKFPNGKTFKAEPKNFEFGYWEGMRYTVVKSETKESRDKDGKDPLHVHIHFTTSKPSWVQKNGDNTPMEAFHVSKHEKMFLNNHTNRKLFKKGDLIRHTSQAEEKLTPRLLHLCPLRVVGDSDGDNGFSFGKIEVTLRTDAEPVKGSLFSKESDIQCVVEVLKKDLPDLSLLNNGVTVAWTIDLDNEKAVVNEKRTLSNWTSIPPDDFQRKDGFRLTLIKQDG